jgi:hypothetical protein
MQSSSSSSAVVERTEKLRNRPEWMDNNYALLKASFRQFAEMSAKDFRMYLVETELEKTCNLTRRPDFQHSWDDVVFSNFARYIDLLVTTLASKRRDLLAILMEFYLPLAAYSFEERIKESDLEFFTLFLKQGHAPQELKGKIERYIARYGVIDVLDFFLAFEKEGEEEKVLHVDIVYYACLHKNVDILDRVLVRGYATNVASEDGMFLPIYLAIDDNTACLDRLIMYGVDVNLTTKGFYPPLITAVSRNKMNIVNRLVDVGARIENERDIPFLFGGTLPTPEMLLKLMEAGLDLEYRTDKGTTLEIVSSRRNYATNSYQREACDNLIHFIHGILQKKEQEKK